MRRAGRAALVVGLVGLGAVGWVASVFGQGGTPPSAPTASEAEVLALKERAAAFWAARVAGDVETQWQLLEPRWKGRMTAADYGSDLTGGKWLAYQVEGAAVSGFFGTVTVRVLVQQILPLTAASRTRATPQVTNLRDGWIRIGGLWYRRLDGGEPAPSRTGQP